MKKSKRVLSMVLIFSLCMSLFGIFPIQVSADENEEVTPIYMDTSYSFMERAADLVSRMTLAEKASQLNTSAPAIPRLGIKANNWWQEALHGAAWTRAVSFPSSLSMSLTWDPVLLYETASIIGDECRAHNTSNGRPLSNFCPTINIQRDPRWGRNEEGYGEDPYLVAVLGEQYINGIQGNLDTENVTSPSGEKYLKTIATLKHYAANNSEQNRYTGSSNVDDRTLREYYTYAFRYITENANPESVMSAYNRVNEIPCAANTYLLDTLLRKTWNFGGYVVSDCEGISWMRNGHNWIPSNPPGIYTQRVTMPQATAFALMAGNDLACNWTQSGSYGGDFSNNLAAAIEQKILTDNGIMTEDIADRALVRLFTARMKTGEFDPKTFEYSKYTEATHVESAYNVAKSLESSRNAIVMLKNDDNTLPINLEKVKSIVVLGKFLDRCELGDTNYAGSPTTRVSFRQGLTNALKAKGFDTENNLKFINTSGGTVSGYIFNIRGFTINGKSYNAIDATTLSNCRKETNNIGYINDGGYAIFENVDVGSGIESLTADVATNGTNISYKPVVEVRLDGPEGQLIGKVVCQPTSGWQNYTTNVGTGELIHEGGGTRTICLVFTTDQSTGPEWDMEAVKNADLAIYLAGTGKTSELEVAGENRDRSNMNFPANQVSEIKQVIQANPNTVVAIQAVGTMNIGDFVNDAKAILFTSYNGQFQGQAMAEVLLGDHNANGRLSFTWYANESQLPGILDYDIYPSETKYGRTYQYFKGDILYPFGYGLSYTTFEYSNFRIDKKELDANDEFQVSVDVKNTGSVKGKEVVQLYVTTPDAPAELLRPIKRLRAFKNIELAPGETKTVTLTVKVPDLAFFNEDLGKYVVDNGRYGVQISRSSADKDIKFQEYINVTGTLKHEVSVVTAVATQEGDAEKDIPERVFFGKNKVVIPKVAVAMNDETLYGHIKKGDFRPYPEGMTIKYSSNRPEIVTVDENGVIRTNNKVGVATITATVTYNGVSKSDDFVVYVYEPVSVDPIEDKLTGEEVTIKGTNSLGEITIKVTDPDGTVIYSEVVNTANFSKTFKIPYNAKEGIYTVVVGNNSASATTTFNVSRDPNLGEYIVEATFSPNSLRGDELIKANVNVKNIGTGDNPVLVIVTLYDGNNRMVNVSYISKVIKEGKEETLTAGFKMPKDITGHSVHVFVWDGDDLSTTTMQPLSNVTSLYATGLFD